MKQEQYIPPRVEVIEVRCEAGFQASVECWGDDVDITPDDGAELV